MSKSDSERKGLGLGLGLGLVLIIQNDVCIPVVISFSTNHMASRHDLGGLFGSILIDYTFIFGEIF